MTNEQNHAMTFEEAKLKTREELILWLCWNDHNGCYSDQDSHDEGYTPLTKEEALECIESQIGG